MIRMISTWLLIGAFLAALAASGCGTPDAIRRSQQLQLDTMVQYRAEMVAYHEKVRTRLAADKRQELDAALAAALAQAADGTGKVPVATVLEKASKRTALEAEFARNLARLDGEFAQRSVAIDRAIDLARGTLSLMTDYSRLGSAVRSLFVREVESQEIVSQYESERSTGNGGSAGEPEASGG
jgi:hypothetical protein